MRWRGRLSGIFTLCLLLSGGPSIAQATAADSGGRASTAIASPSLADALGTFARQRGLQFVYVSQLADGKVAQPVPVGLSISECLARLLAGTGIDFAFINDRTIKLFEQRVSQTTTQDVKFSEPQHSPRTRSATSGSLDEVVVTAEKRNEFLSTVPMSISVLSGEALAVSGITGIEGIAAVTPSMEYDFSSQYGPGILTNIAIRGISADKGGATTGVYIDDTPIQTSHSTFGNAFPLTFDLAQVETLRGPQGVLFGRGAEGGAIRFVTNEPSTTSFSTLSRAGVSVTDRGAASFETGAAVGGPLVAGSLGARVSAWVRHDGGYVNRIDPFSAFTVDANANRSSSEAFRLAVAFKPSDSIRIAPSVSYQSQRLHDTPIFFNYLSTPHAGVFSNGKLLQQPSADGFGLGSVRIEDRLEGATLISITSYFDRSARATVDTTNAAGVDYFGGFGNPLGPAFPSSYADAVPTRLTLRQRQLSEEVRLTSANSPARLSWVAGIFYSRLRDDTTEDTYLLSAPSDPGILTNSQRVVSELSAFGDARWALSPRLVLGAGMRIGRIQNKGKAYNAGFANGGSPPFLSNRDSERLPPTPRFDLSFQLDNHNLFYAAIASGFRTGGSNGSRLPQCSGHIDDASFRPDSVWSFEVGAKDSLFEERLQLNVSLYSIRRNNIQQFDYDACGNGFFTNAGTALSQGFDLAAEAMLTSRLRASIAVGFLDVHYTRTVATADDRIIVDRGSVVGGIPSVPAPWSGSMQLRYEWPMNSSVTAYSQAEDIVHSRNTGPFTESDPRALSYDPGLRADPATNLFNLQLGVVWSRFDCRLTVNNALNAHPQLQSFADAPRSALVYAYSFRPRTVGLTGSWAF